MVFFFLSLILGKSVPERGHRAFRLICLFEARCGHPRVEDSGAYVLCVVLNSDDRIFCIGDYRGLLALIILLESFLQLVAEDRAKLTI